MLSVEQTLTQKFPEFFPGLPQFVRAPLLEFLRRIFRERTINEFLALNEGVAGFEFVEKVLEYFDVCYSFSNKSRENIPSSGRVIIVANHPLGAIDALCLLKMVSEVRRDVRVVATDLLTGITPLTSLLLPVDNLGKRATQREQLLKIQQTLESEAAVIFFPAGEVSRARPYGVRDGRWSDGFLKFAKRTGSPVLPCYIEARNSSLFYSVSAINKPVSGLLLVNEMFRQKRKTLPIRFGEAISAHTLQSDKRSRKVLVRQLRKHLYKVAKNKPGLFPVESAIAHPESRKALRTELQLGRLLGRTSDSMGIYLFDYRQDSVVMRELGRLREISFRKVGEGTGKRLDLDQHDQL